MASRRAAVPRGSFLWGRDGPRAPVLRPGALRTTGSTPGVGARDATLALEARAKLLVLLAVCATCSLRQPRVWQNSFSFISLAPSKAGEIIGPRDPAQST